MAGFRQILRTNLIVSNPSNFLYIRSPCSHSQENVSTLLYNQKAGMATLKAVKNRLKGVQNIQKITNSMKMVATSRMKAVKRERDRTELFNRTVPSFVNTVQGSSATLVSAADQPQQEKARSRLVIAVTTDKGLCGSINSQISKRVRAIVENSVSDHIPIKIVILGEKGRAQLKRTCGTYFIQSFSDFGKKPASFLQASTIADFLVKQEAEEILIIYNKFVSAIKFDTLEQKLVTKLQLFKSTAKFEEYEFDSDNLESVWEIYIANTIHRVLMDNATAEISARANAMDNASKNAKEMINKLTLLKNRTRQALITKELSEIVSGKEALESK